jgi:hypothetical protein
LTFIAELGMRLAGINEPGKTMLPADRFSVNRALQQPTGANDA